LFALIGCAIWSTALGVLGYDLGSSYNNVLKDFRDAAIWQEPSLGWPSLHYSFTDFGLCELSANGALRMKK
jgi:hypothetical protein